MRVFFIPWGHVNFHDHIWALRRHLGHMTYMLDSDWLKNFFAALRLVGTYCSPFYYYSHMDAMLKLKSVSTMVDIKKIRQRYDQIEIHVRGLQEKGVDSA